MIPLVGPFSEIAKRRFDLKCERIASGTKKSTAVKLTVGVLVASMLIFICLGAEVVREAAIANAAEQKVQADGGASLKDENPDYAGWLSVEGTSISTPVVSCRQGDPNGFYLNHGFDRLPSFSGCPFIAEALRHQVQTCSCTLITWDMEILALPSSRIVIGRIVLQILEPRHSRSQMTKPFAIGRCLA